jgi:integrase
MPSLRKVPGSPFWIACFRDSDGRQYNRSTKRKDKKSAFAVALEFERMAGGWLKENPTTSALYGLAASLSERIGQPMQSVTIRQEFEAYLSGLESKSASTRVRYDQIIREFLSSLGDAAKKNLTALSSADVLAFRDARLKAGISPTSSDFELKLIRSVLKKAMVAGRIPSNPAAAVDSLNEKGAVRGVFEPEQVRALLMACEGFKKKGRNCGNDWRGACMVAFYTGARLSDVANLKWANLDLQKRLLFYSEKKKRFQSEIRVPLHEELENHLLSLEAPDDPEAPLFPGLAGRETGGANGLSREFVGLMDAAGIERRLIRKGSGVGRDIYDLGEHSFRHSFNTHLMRAGVPEDLRQRLCGHESKEVSRRYTHKEVEDLRASIAKLPAVSAFPAKKSSAKRSKSKGAR